MKKLILKFKSLKKSYKIVVIIIVITLAWMLSGAIMNTVETTDNRTIAKKEANNKNQLQTVRVMKVNSEKMMQNVSISGKTESSRTVVLKAETPGRVESIDFEKGGNAKGGTTLISLAVDDRESLHDKAKSNLRAKEITYDAKIKLQEKGLSSIAAVAIAKSELDQAGAYVETARLNLAHTKIKAPFEGVVEDRYVEVGDFISIGQNVAKIVDLDPIRAVGYISENIRHNVSLGSKATIILPNKTIEGKITYISSSSNDATRTYRFEVEIPNSENEITEGLTCTIKIDVATLTAHSISPSLIVLNDKGEMGIRVITEEDIVNFLPVEFLTDENEQIWLSGLPDEFTIITVGHEYVKDGNEVMPIYEEVTE